MRVESSKIGKYVPELDTLPRAAELPRLPPTAPAPLAPPAQSMQTQHINWQHQKMQVPGQGVVAAAKPPPTAPQLAPQRPSGNPTGPTRTGQTPFGKGGKQGMGKGKNNRNGNFVPFYVLHLKTYLNKYG